MEQIIFIALIAIVGLLRWLSQAAENKKNAETARRAGNPPPDAPMQRAPADSEEERIRRFMEALGVPTSSPPLPDARRQPREGPRSSLPPPPAKRSFLPKIPPMAPAWPPLTSAPPELSPAPAPVPAREPAILREEPPRRKPRKMEVAASFEVRDIDERVAEDMPLPSAQGAPSSEEREARTQTLVERLARSQQGLRDAMVLREIFGPPRSMQMFG